jgi:pimeloyl-ACP methyl ester carboxylesterase
MRRGLLLLLALPSCPHRATSITTSSGPSDPGSASAVVSDADAGATLPPLGGVPWQMDLTDETTHKPIGSVSIPLGAREKRPILIALHGAGDRPGWACGEWRGVVNAYPFIVCPRGQGASEANLYWQSPEKTKEGIDVMLAATRKLFAPWIDETESVVIVGFSMGTTEASVLAARDPKRYPRIVLTEGSFDATATETFTRAYHGERALFACTTRGCPSVYLGAARALSRRGIACRVNDAGTTQHGIWESVVHSLRRDWPWVVSGMPGWSRYTPLPEEADAGSPGTTTTF